MPTAVLFPGQGSLRSVDPIAWREMPEWEVVEVAAAVLGLDSDEVLPAGSETASALATQLEVFLCSLMAYRNLQRHIDETPRVAAGHSFGQITALVAAGALSLEDGVRLVRFRSEVVQMVVRSSPGRMLAVTGLGVDGVRAHTQGSVWLANDNAPAQVVLAGDPDELAEVAERLAAERIKVMWLDIDGAYHTPLLDSAAPLLELFCEGLSFRQPTFPVITNGDAEVHRDGQGWAARLARHVAKPVRWRESMLTLASLGVDEVYAVGPAAALAGLLRRTTDLRAELVDRPLTSHPRTGSVA